MRGKPRSEETKRKISLSLTGESNPMFGKHLSEETREKISLSSQGRIVSTETKTKISQSKLGTKHSEETKKKLSIINKNRSPEIMEKLFKASKNGGMIIQG